MQDGRDIWWDAALAAADPVCPPAELDAEHPLFILYSSGSTAKPKGILHTTGGYLTGVAWTHKYVFDLKPESDVYWCSADVGWVTGHSYIVYGPLANGATSVMYEGAPDYPTRTSGGAVPSAGRDDLLHGADRDPHLHEVGRGVRAAPRPGEAAAARERRRADQPEGLALVLARRRRRALPGRRHLVADRDGNIMITTLPGAQAAKPGSAGTPLPGLAAQVVDNDGAEVERDVQGLLTLRRPWPGMLRTLYREPERYGPVTGSASARRCTSSATPVARTPTTTSG